MIGSTFSWPSRRVAGFLAVTALAVPPAQLAAQATSGSAAAASMPAAPSAGTPLALSLTEALRRALTASEQIAIARASEQRARGQQQQARSGLLPQVSASMGWQKTIENQFAAIAAKNSSGNGSSSGSSSSTGGGSDQTASFARIFASEYQLNGGIAVTQPIYTGGRARAALRASQLGQAAAEIGITSAQAQSQLDVTQAYYDALLTDRLLTIADSTIVQAERTLRQVQLTRSVGSASEFELVRAKVTRDNQRPGWLQARTNRDLAYVRLRQLLNLPDDQPVTLTDSILEAPAAAAVPVATAPITTVQVAAAEVLTIDPAVRARIARTLGEADTTVRVRAPVRQAEQSVAVAAEQLRIAKAGRLPSLAATTNYQRLSYPVNILPKSLGDFYPNWTVGLGLQYPLFTGGRVQGDIQIAEAGVVEAKQRLRLAQEGAALDAHATASRLTEAEAAWQASLGTAEQAQRAYDIAEVRFKEGISTQLELSDIRVQLQQALANRARAARDLQVARKRLELLRDLPLSSGSTTSPGSTP